MAIRYKILLSSLLLTITACGGMSANQASSASRAPAASSVFMTNASIDGQMVPLLRFGGGGSGAHRTLVMNPQAGIDYASVSGFEGGLVMVAIQPNAGTHAVYTCSFPVPEAIGMRFFLSGDPNCEGQQRVSDNWGLSQFYMADTPIDGMSRPLYRCVNSGSDHLDTTDPNECYAAGYRVEGILGFGG